MASTHTSESSGMLNIPDENYFAKQCTCRCSRRLLIVTQVICLVTSILVVSCTAYVAHTAATLGQPTSVTVASQTFVEAASLEGYLSEDVDEEMIFDEDDEDTDQEEEDDAEDGYDDTDDDFSGDMSDVNLRGRRAVKPTRSTGKRTGRKGNANNKQGRTRGSENKRGRKKKQRAAHYPAEIPQDIFDHQVRGAYDAFNDMSTGSENDGCSQVYIYQGVVCRNGTYIPLSKDIRIFNESTLGDSPLTYERSNGFIVKKSGIIMAYAQVTFNRSAVLRNGLSLRQTRAGHTEPIQKLMNIQDGPGTSPAYVMGIFNARKNDVFKVVSTNSQSHIVHTKGATYFGALQLA